MSIRKFTYTCDAGGILVGNDSFQAHFNNFIGDGCYDVYVNDENSFDKFPEGTKFEDWKFIEVVQGKFNLYDYDCGMNNNVLCELDGCYAIYANRSNELCGDMYLERWRDRL